MQYQFQVLKEDDGQKAHEVLVKRHLFSRVQVKKIRLYGELLVNGKPQRMIDPLREGDFVELRYDAENELPHDLLIEPQEDIPIFYQDEWILVVGKPANLLTHPSYTGEKESLITRLSNYKLHPVTRLDRGTSGLIILAKSGQAHYSLIHTEVKKSYQGLVFSGPNTDEGSVLGPIARVPDSIIEREVRHDGKESRTDVRVLKKYGKKTVYASMLEFTLITGRTHQIRVHCRHEGYPMMGDSLYPPKPECVTELQKRLGKENYTKMEALSQTLGHQALHAAKLSFIHPYSRDELSFSMPFPQDVLNLEKALIKLFGSFQ